MRCIVIDIGSSYIKSAVFDTEQACLYGKRVVAGPPRLKSQHELAFEVPARLFTETVATVIDEAVARSGPLDGVILATQMHGFVLADPASKGEDVYVSWQDARCLETMPGSDVSSFEHLKTVFSPRDMQDNGVYIKPALGLCNLFARMRSGEQVYSDGSAFHTLGSYIIRELTGNNVCHITNGAPTGLVDVRRRRWNADTIARAGFDRFVFPELTDCMEPCGVYHGKGGDIPIYPDVGDMQAAVIGCLPRDGEVVANIATGAQLIRMVSDFTPDAAMRYEIRPYFEGCYLNTVSSMPGGRNLDVLVDFIAEIGEKIYGASPGDVKIWDRLDAAFENSSRLDSFDSELVVDANFYQTPDLLPSGAIKNINSHDLTLDSLFAATYKGMARIYAKYLSVLCHGAACAGLVFSGGVSWKNRHLPEAIAREVALPSRRSAMRDECFMGLARLAMVCSGACRTLADTQNLVIAEHDEKDCAR